MNQRSQTPDERLLIKLYQVAMESGDPFSHIDLRGAAASLGQKEIAVKNIVKLLAQANFVKKIDDSTVHLTQRGCDFVLDFLEGS
ncbi:MAG: hypothetical protein HW387_605 [Parachlamydiales bacterium]|nr:hypothetical protein [Parachlamydiales bacterium]